MATIYQKENNTRFKLTYHELWVFIVLICALATRLLLAGEYWPMINSDEATIGLMGMHIQHGELPIFFYGQHYMGALEAYLAAFFYSLFGVSIFSLRLSLILLYMLFLITMYVLVRMLYSKNFALATIVLLSLGSNAVLSRELSAIGGYTETLLFSALSFLIAAWLALPAPSGTKRNVWPWRLLGYCAWGLVIGLGIWSDLLILPFALCSGFILLVFCWRELVKGAVLPLILFLLLGAAPLIIYNLHPVPGQDSWSVLMSQQGHLPITFSIIKKQIKNTLELSIPIITGSPFCHFSEYSWLNLLGFQTSRDFTLQCHVITIGWSISYLSLYGLSMGLLIAALWKRLFPLRFPEWTFEERATFTKNMVKFLLGVSGVLTIFLYVRSSAPLGLPAVYSRYMIGLWLVTPVILWPIWKRATSWGLAFASRDRSLAWFTGIVSTALLVVIMVIFSYGTAYTLHEIPAAIRAQQHDQVLIDGLQKKNQTHPTQEYWTCNMLIFESKEHIICGVVYGFNLTEGFTRGKQYFITVSNDPQSSYIFPPGNDQMVAGALQHFQQKNIPFRRFTIEDYVIFQPLTQ